MKDGTQSIKWRDFVTSPTCPRHHRPWMLSQARLQPLHASGAKLRGWKVPTLARRLLQLRLQSPCAHQESALLSPLIWRLSSNRDEQEVWDDVLLARYLKGLFCVDIDARHEAPYLRTGFRGGCRRTRRGEWLPCRGCGRHGVLASPCRQTAGEKVDSPEFAQQAWRA